MDEQYRRILLTLESGRPILQVCYGLTLYPLCKLFEIEEGEKGV